MQRARQRRECQHFRKPGRVVESTHPPEQFGFGSGLHLQLSFLDTLEGMKKPLKCLLMLHEWRLKTNDEGQQYKICDRCGAYRDFTPAAGAS